MAQFKDLLVTGPVRMTSDIYFKNGKLSDGYLVLEPTAGEGGQILLSAAVNDQTNNGIIIDTANGNFRIFGNPSRNSTSKTDVGSVLNINPYSKLIDASDYELKIKPSATTPESYNILVQESSGADKTICSTSQNDFIQDLRLSQVYNYKGTVTWAELKQISSAKVGDVYFISGTDGANKTGQSWACTQKVTEVTGNNYATYWQSLGNYLDLSGYVTKDTTQTISGQKTLKENLKYSTTNYTSTPLAIYDDGTAYGHTLVIGAGGTTYIGAGESAQNLYEKILKTTSTETLILGADGNILFQAGADSATATNGILLDKNNYFYPQTNNSGQIGTDNNSWNAIYATTFFGALSGNATTATTLATARDFTIGNTAKFFDGSAAVSWTSNEIGYLYKWDAIVQGTTWSRLCYVPAAVNVEGSKYILNISATRGNVVYNDTFLITAHHSQNGKIIKLAGNNYTTGHQLRLVVNSNGDSYIELYDNAQSITTATKQTVHCRLIPIFVNTAPTLYTSFTSGATVPSGYTVKQTMTINSTDIQGNLSGNADTASKWQTARTISISSSAGTTGTTVDGSDNKTLVIPSTITGFNSITSTTFVGNVNGTLDGIDSTGFLRNYISHNELSTTETVGTPSYLYTVSSSGNVVATTTRPTGQTDNAWGILHVHTHSGNYATQIGFATQANRLFFRNAHNTDMFGDWQTILASNNYTDYTVTKTGTGASGTWGINITGNAATATKATKDGDGNIIKDTYLKLAGGTLTGPLTFANGPSGIWNIVGDNSMFGDQNVAGAFCIKGNNGTTTLRMYSYDTNVTTTANFQYNTADKCIDVIFN